jgi:hypothetical protein
MKGNVLRLPVWNEKICGSLTGRADRVEHRNYLKNTDCGARIENACGVSSA